MDRVRSLSALAAFLIAAVTAAAVPLLGHASMVTKAAGEFGGWPTAHEGRALTELPLSEREVAFLRDFPGRVGRFSDGRREIIIRFVSAATRRLHPAADCFRASGYKVVPIPAMRDRSGATMGCFRALRGSEELRVCEMIRDERGGSFSDVSAWYWHALFGSSPAPWWSFVVAERS